MSINVDPVSGAVEVVLPARASERAAASAVKELGPWIEKQQDKALAARQRVLDRRGTVPYLDETLRLAPESGRTPSAGARGSRPTVLVGPTARRGRTTSVLDPQRARISPQRV